MGIPIDIKHEIPEHGAAKFKKISDALRHPLDPLSPAELEEAVRILTREKYLGDNVRIASINMMEPAKSLVEKHLPGPFERKAVAVLLNRGKRASCEVVLDMVSKSVTSVTQLPSGVQPSI